MEEFILKNQLEIPPDKLRVKIVNERSKADLLKERRKHLLNINF